MREHGQEIHTYRIIDCHGHNWNTDIYFSAGIKKGSDAAKTAVCINNNKSIGIAQIAYQSDENDAMIPAGNQFANLLGNFMSIPKSEAWNGSDLNKELVTKGNVFYCPAGYTDRISEHAKSGKWNWISFTETQLPWRSRSESMLGTVGGYDLWVMPVGSSGSQSGTGWKFNNWQVNDPQENKWPSTNYIFDTSRAAATHDGTHHLNGHNGDGSRIVSRHNGFRNNNVLFFDGHVATMARNTVFAGAYKNGDSDHPDFQGS